MHKNQEVIRPIADSIGHILKLDITCRDKKDIKDLFPKNTQLNALILQSISLDLSGFNPRVLLPAELVSVSPSLCHLTLYGV